jgi:hypothetical protein
MALSPKSRNNDTCNCPLGASTDILLSWTDSDAVTWPGCNHLPKIAVNVIEVIINSVFLAAHRAAEISRLSSDYKPEIAFTLFARHSINYP